VISLAWPWVLLALPLPWLVRRFLPAARERTGGALRAPVLAGMVAQDARRGGEAGPRIERWVAWAAWLLLVTAAARPQWLGAPVGLPVSGRDLMLAVDISGSMARPDYELDGERATRLDVVKQVAGHFIHQRTGDRIGLILFGTRAYLQTPLTFDRHTVRTMLDEAQVGFAGRNTALGDAIGLAIKRLHEEHAHDRVLVLLTDGASNAGEVSPRQAAKLAADAGVRIYTIGIGAGRRRVMTVFGMRYVNTSADLDEDTLKAIARITRGTYFRARDTAALKDVYRRLDRLEPAVADTAWLRPLTALYYWPLGLAFVLALWLGFRRAAPLRLRVPRPTVKREGAGA